MLPKISLIDRYIIKQLVITWIFGLAICTTLGELIGISFEQIRFVVEREFPMITSLQVHLLKLPAFISLALPFSLLMAAIITYSQLARRNEIIALRSLGTSLTRLMVPTLILSFVVATSMFVWDEAIVPYANYQAAIIIENKFKVDRNNLAKYQKKNIIYQEFLDSGKQRSLKFILVADRFDGQKLLGVTLLEFTKKHLHKIVIASAAVWNNKKKLWYFFNCHQYIIDGNGFYTQVDYFEKSSISLSENIFNYIKNYRDNREMNILELYQRLSILQVTNNTKQIRQLKINIQERYALPFSCVVFALLGAVLGCDSQLKINSFTLTVIIIFIYQATQFLSTSFSMAGLIPITVGVWLPNIFGLSLSTIILSFNKRPR